MKTFFRISKVSDRVRRSLLAEIASGEVPTIESALAIFESRHAGVKPGALYDPYRMLCEYSHVDFFKTAAYPRLGLESAEILDLRRSFFLWVASAGALSIPALSHCPPSCGFPDAEYERIRDLAAKAWQDLPSAS